jgi:cytochrome P450
VAHPAATPTVTEDSEMTAPSSEERVLDDEWCAHHFDHLAPELGEDPHPVLACMRDRHRIAHSDERGGFWLVTRHADVVRVAQDWASFSSAHGITVPSRPTSIPALPEQVDPPLHREYKRLINAHFSPTAVLEHEPAVRSMVSDLIDGFIGDGRCDVMADFAQPLPGLVFFDLFLHAPADELAEINRLATLASNPFTREAIDARIAMLGWIGDFAERRRDEGPRGDVVDAVLAAEIEGRPITQDEIVGVIQLLLFGGLDTTAGALGMMVIRFCRQPEIPALLREDPSRIPDAVEELLRLDGPFAFIARTALTDVEIGGRTIPAGDKVLISWIAANRDEAEFADADSFSLDRASNRHVAFGAGPHRCAGSHLARMNLRVALEALVERLEDLALADPGAPIPFHAGYSRSPTSLPVTFRPGPAFSPHR